MQHLNQIVGVVIKVEGSGIGWHIARIRPVGDVDIMSRQHAFDGIAQQCCVMARHGCDDQQLVLRCREIGLLEMQQAAEGFLPDNGFGNLERAFSGFHPFNVEDRFGIAARQTLEQVQRGFGLPPELGVGQGIALMQPEFRLGPRGKPPRRHGSVLHFIELIKHG